jgi:hypothetical protein
MHSEIQFDQQQKIEILSKFKSSLKICIILQNSPHIYFDYQSILSFIYLFYF